MKLIDPDQALFTADEYNALEQEIESLRSDLEKANERCSQWADIAGEHGEKKDKLKEEIESLRSQTEILRITCDAHITVIQDTEKEIDSLRTHIQALEDRELDSVAEVDKELRKAQREIESLRSELGYCNKHREAAVTNAVKQREGKDEWERRAKHLWDAIRHLGCLPDDIKWFDDE